MVPYLEMLIKNGLAEIVEGEHLRYRTTPVGMQALRHMCKLEKLMQEMGVENVLAERII